MKCEYHTFDLLDKFISLHESLRQVIYAVFDICWRRRFNCQISTKNQKFVVCVKRSLLFSQSNTISTAKWNTICEFSGKYVISGVSFSVGWLCCCFGRCHPITIYFFIRSFAHSFEMSKSPNYMVHGRFIRLLSKVDQPQTMRYLKNNSSGNNNNNGKRAKQRIRGLFSKMVGINCTNALIDFVIGAVLCDQSYV